jgi:hypothetical protein
MQAGPVTPALLTIMLVEQARTYSDAVKAVFERAKGMPYVGELEIEGMPLLGWILVLANRQGLTDDQIRQLENRDSLRDLAMRGAQSEDGEGQMAGSQVLRWLDEPVQAGAAHKTLVWVAVSQLLARGQD